jgi:hypothetical protein
MTIDALQIKTCNFHIPAFFLGHARICATASRRKLLTNASCLSTENTRKICSNISPRGASLPINLSIDGLISKINLNAGHINNTQWNSLVTPRKIHTKHLLIVQVLSLVYRWHSLLARRAVIGGRPPDGSVIGQLQT